MLPPPSERNTTGDRSAESVSESFFGVVEALCSRFIGLTPFEVLNTPTREVYDLFTDTLIHDRKAKGEKMNGGETARKWVTSKDATWH